MLRKMQDVFLITRDGDRITILNKDTINVEHDYDLQYMSFTIQELDRFTVEPYWIDDVLFWHFNVFLKDGRTSRWSTYNETFYPHVMDRLQKLGVISWQAEVIE